jgi:hypothetical protein
VTDQSGAGLEPIETHVRDEDPPAGAVLVVRGGPLSVERLVEHARRQAREFSYQGAPMFSVSVDATVGAWTLEKILRDRLWSRSTYAACPVAQLRAAGYELLATHGAPHYDVIVADAEPTTAATLLAVFGTAEVNPFKRRRR